MACSERNLSKHPHHLYSFLKLATQSLLIHSSESSQISLCSQNAKEDSFVPVSTRGEKKIAPQTKANCRIFCRVHHGEPFMSGFLTQETREFPADPVRQSSPFQKRSRASFFFFARETSASRTQKSSKGGAYAHLTRRGDSLPLLVVGHHGSLPASSIFRTQLPNNEDDIIRAKFGEFQPAFREVGSRFVLVAVNGGFGGN